MAELQLIIMFHGRRFVCNLGIYNPICVKLLQNMSGVISRNLKKNDVSISNRFPEVHKRDTHRYTHDDSIRRNAMCCISNKKQSDRTWDKYRAWEIKPNKIASATRISLVTHHAPELNRCLFCENIACLLIRVLQRSMFCPEVATSCQKVFRSKRQVKIFSP